ncbi:MAG: HDOD domain-containing protein [Planctomycetes bacterium]|nr:HDOD domain-containing protein [Planctomycetota bacterium]
MAVAKSIEAISRRIQRDDHLPVLPQIVTRVREVAGDRDASASDLAEVILKDQSLTAKILRVVNSPFYRQYARKVTTVTQAIVVLGFENVRNITLAGTAQSVLSAFSDRRVLTDFWSHSLATAVAAQMVAQESRLPVTEEAFVGGLLHDVGKLLLASYFPEDYAGVLDDVRSGLTYLVAERRRLGTDHVEVGIELARKWRFDDTLETTIRRHHDMASLAPVDREPIPRIVAFSNLLTATLYRDVGPGRGVALEKLLLEGPSFVSLRSDALREMLSALRDRIEELAHCFGIEIGELPELPEDFGTVRGADREEKTRRPARDSERILRSEIERQQQWMGYVSKITEALVRETELRSILTLVLQAATRGLGAERALFVIRDAVGAKLRIAFAEGERAGPELKSFEEPLAMDAGLLARTVLEGKPHNVPDADDPLYGAPLSPREREILGSRAIATIPVKKKGQVVGVLVALNPRKGNPIPDGDVPSLLLLANYASLALERV